MPRLILVIAAATFAFFGLTFLVNPAGMASVVELHPATSTSTTDIRAVYGGLELGIAALLSAALRTRVREGLLMATILFGGLLLGRITGILVDGPVSPTTWRVFSAELFATLGSAFGLFLTRRLS